MRCIGTIRRGIPGWDKVREGRGTELRVGDVREGSSGGHVEIVCRWRMWQGMTRFKRTWGLKHVIWPGVMFALCDSSILLTSPQDLGLYRVTLNIHKHLDIKKQLVSPMCQSSKRVYLS